ncbi:MAG TPA: hypothetical protein VGM88_31385 [Kofleriaceae bacterium]|jgi:hypothetical protein
MRIHLSFIASGLIAAAALTACGGDDGGSGGGFSGDATLTYDGTDITGIGGIAFAQVEGSDSVFAVFVGNVSVSCSDMSASAPPDGTYASIIMADSTTGTKDALVSLEKYAGGAETADGASASGSVDVTASSSSSITVDISETFSGDDGNDYGVDGTFTVSVCS